MGVYHRYDSKSEFCLVYDNLFFRGKISLSYKTTIFFKEVNFLNLFEKWKMKCPIIKFIERHRMKHTRLVVKRSNKE
jgi:hypothetical protein